MQADVENKIIYVGTNIINKSLKPKVSKTFRLNQVNAASVADYLSTLGANISKVMLMSGSFDGQEIGDSFINKKEFEDEVINSYEINHQSSNIRFYFFENFRFYEGILKCAKKKVYFFLFH